ncbi:MAG: di-trans,poly-cis-decaprenylcistransferase, partial [Spirochaetae bacterium HGW-Spirochaetae-6]
FYKKEFPEIHAQGIKILHSGIYPPLPEETIKILEKVAWETKDNTKGTLNLCINYGGRVEILEGIKKVLLDMESGKIQASALDTGFFRNYLFQPGVPDVDFMIRTSGEERISDFLLWQSAYAELYFTQTLWPDFDAEELYKALQVYQARERRYGGAQS